MCTFCFANGDVELYIDHVISILYKIVDHVLFSGIGFTVHFIRQVYDLREGFLFCVLLWY